MTDLVYLGDPPPYIVIPPTTVREWKPSWERRWLPWSASEAMWQIFQRYPSTIRERTVPVSLDLDAECPTCGGTGKDPLASALERLSAVLLTRCTRCGGSGVVPTLWHAVWQHEVTSSLTGRKFWYSCGAPDRTDEAHITRLAVPARYAVQKLPVVDWRLLDGPDDPQMNYIREPAAPGESDGVVIDIDGGADKLLFKDHPQLAGLVPGATVLALGDRIELNEPIVEEVGGCSECEGDGLMDDGGQVGSCDVCSGTGVGGWPVPLVLVPGLNTVELAR